MKKQILWLLDYCVAILVTAWLLLELIHYYFLNHGIDIPLPDILTKATSIGGLAYGLIVRFVHQDQPPKEEIKG